MAYTTINKPNSYFDTQTWVGTNASGRTFTGLNFQPDYIWVKCYNSSNYYQMMVDRVRGGNYFLATAITAAEDNKSHGEITSWNSGGTTWIDGTNASYPRLYYNDGVGSSAGGSEYVAWQFKAGNSAGSSNTSGSITSTVSASTTSGFSIVSYTGTGSSATVGHGLGLTPKFIIVKNRTSAGNWMVWVSTFTINQGLNLDNTDGTFTSGSTFISSVGSTTFTIGNSSIVNTNTNNYIAYCFADVKGYSKFGSYTGNGSTDGTFVYTGFKPAFVLIKQSSAAGEFWTLSDNKRVADYNVTDARLFPNSQNAESSNGAGNIDFLSNGFKIRNSDAPMNTSSATYIYMCFASNPFVTSGGIPVTAR